MAREFNETSLKLLIAATLAAALALSAQDENFKLSVRSNLVFLPTRVRTKKGDTIHGLRPEQFVVEDNGVRQSIKIEDDPDSSPGLSLAVLVQCSRSASTEFNKLKGLPAMIEAIAGDAPHEIAVVSYGSISRVLVDFSPDSEAALSALSGLRPCDDYKAASIDAVYHAINMLQQRHNRYRRAILLISETRDHGSRAKLSEVVAELGITSTVIYSVAFSPTRDEFLSGMRYGDHPPPPPKSSSPAEQESTPRESPPVLDWIIPQQFQPIVNALRRNAASELASLSGGEYINFTTQRGFDNGLQRITNQIHNYYPLSFQPSSTQQSSLHSLRVRIPDHPDAVVQTRRSYWFGIHE
jgi:VWFA-related protein